MGGGQYYKYYRRNSTGSGGACTLHMLRGVYLALTAAQPTSPSRRYHNHQVLSVVGLLQDDTDPMVSVMKVEKAPLESYADVGGLEQQVCYAAQGVWGREVFVRGRWRNQKEGGRLGVTCRPGRRLRVLGCLSRAQPLNLRPKGGCCKTEAKN